jgi:hypothetical protein
MIGAAWLAIKAFGIWGRIGRALGAAWAWAARTPFPAALALCGLLLMLCAHVISVERHTIARLTTQANAFRAAQDEAEHLAQEALHHQEALYRAKAQDADHAYQTQLAAAQSAADRYIAGHRVHTDGSRGASGAPASAPGGGAASPDRPDNPADMVAVSADDINACTVNSTRLQAARDWALGINSATP